MHAPLKKAGCGVRACLHNAGGGCAAHTLAVYARPDGAYCATYIDVRDAVAGRGDVEASAELGGPFPRVMCGQGGCAHNTAGTCGAFVLTVEPDRGCGVYLPRVPFF